jgi:hypothetical protein
MCGVQMLPCMLQEQCALAYPPAWGGQRAAFTISMPYILR